MAWVLVVLIFVAAAIAAYTLRMHLSYGELRWDWSGIDVDDVTFPEGFVWGTATAAHQVEGGNTNNNWYRWETTPDDHGKPRVHGGAQSGDACEHWSRYPEDIRRMKEELQASSYRFSIEWSRIEPEPGRFDQDAIAHYHDVIDTCLKNDVQPMVTLHHFTHPIWFDDRGSFEKLENVDTFVGFASKMFQEYGDKVPRWCTHNEPGPFATMGWLLGVFPPGHKSLGRYARTLCNLMHSHARVYQAIKALPHGNEVEVALVKNIFQLDPMDRWHPGQWALCRFGDLAYNEAILSALKTGTFSLKVPGLVNVEEEIPGLADSLDFLGLNYYSHLLIRLMMRREPPFETLARPGDIKCDMPYCIYPEGMYRALKRAGEVGKPIVITECGIPDDKDDRRAWWIRSYAYAMRRAMDEGVDVQGFHYWSLLDNFEWAEGWDPRFGLFAVDYETQERTLRPGSQAFIDLVGKTG